MRHQKAASPSTGSEESWVSELQPSRSGRSPSPSPAPESASPPARRSRRFRRATPENTSSDRDTGAEPGSALQRLLVGDDGVRRRARQRVQVDSCDPSGTPYHQEELRRMRRRKTNRESAARVRQQQAKDKELLREEVAQLMAQNAQLNGDLLAANERISAVSGDLARFKDKYQNALRDKSSLQHSVQSMQMLTPPQPAFAEPRLSASPCTTPFPPPLQELLTGLIPKQEPHISQGHTPGPVPEHLRQEAEALLTPPQDTDSSCTPLHFAAQVPAASYLAHLQEAQLVDAQAYAPPAGHPFFLDPALQFAGDLADFNALV